MSVRDEVVELLQGGARVGVPDEPVDENLKAWAMNLTAAYHELGSVAVRLAEHVDHLEEKIAAFERHARGESVFTRGATNPGR